MGASTSHVETSTEHKPNFQPKASYNPTATGYLDGFVRQKLEECNCDSVLQVFVGKFIFSSVYI